MGLGKLFYYIFSGLSFGAMILILNYNYFIEPYPTKLWIIGVINWLSVFIMLLLTIFSIVEYNKISERKDVK